MRGTQRPADAQVRRPKPNGCNSVVVNEATFADVVHQLFEFPLRAFPPRAVS